MSVEEYRCEGRVHAKIVNGEMEVKCRSKVCGAQSGVVVLHYFNIDTGELLRTNKFRDPVVNLERKAQ